MNGHPAKGKGGPRRNMFAEVNQVFLADLRERRARLLQELAELEIAEKVLCEQAKETKP